MIGVAYGPADNGCTATYAIVAQVGPEAFRVARVAVTARDSCPSMREVRRMRPTGATLRTMRLGPGGLTTVMVHPWRDTRNSAQWPRRKPRVTLPDVPSRPDPRWTVLAPCPDGCGGMIG